MGYKGRRKRSHKIGRRMSGGNWKELTKRCKVDMIYTHRICIRTYQRIHHSKQWCQAMYISQAPLPHIPENHFQLDCTCSRSHNIPKGYCKGGTNYSNTGGHFFSPESETQNTQGTLYIQIITGNLEMPTNYVTEAN